MAALPCQEPGCGKGFNTAGNLREHVRFHRDSPCRILVKAISLLPQMATHSDDKRELFFTWER